MAIDAENDARAMRGDPPIVRTDPNEQLRRQQDLEQKQQLITAAKGLIDSGVVDPKFVGQMLPTMQQPQNPMAFPASGGITFENMMAFYEMMEERKDKRDAQSDYVSRLEKKIDDFIENGGRKRRRRSDYDDDDEDIRPKSASDMAVEQAKSIAAWHSTLVDLGIVPSRAELDTIRKAAAGQGSTRKTIEEIKEENRHHEKMMELDETREHHVGLRANLEDMSERIGKGLASHFMSQSGNGHQAASTPLTGGLSKFTCTECGGDIIVTPETGERIVCPNPKCGQVFARQVIKDTPKDELI
jgi:hypothetical protein